ncbi:MAG TPA: OsmC family protein [Planctomycetota bacterium]|jgi:putative redox protein
MVEMNCVYEGDLHCQATHGPSGSVISTDAPKDNQGRGEAFSPTDLMGAALGTCMLTIMGIYARRHEINLSGASAKVAKDMTATPVRRIGKLTVVVRMPAAVAPDQRKPLESAALACPVYQSLHPEIQKEVKFEYV